MKIAHILPHSIKLPLTSHNGRYDWMLAVVHKQIKAGHDVTIFCHPDSEIGNIRTIGIEEESGNKELDNISLFERAFEHKADIYHSHLDNLHYKIAHMTDKPIVYTQHWWPTEETVKMAKQYSPKNVWAVPPTKHMYEMDKKLGIQTKGHIYHGIDLEQFGEFGEISKNNRLLFVSRISPEKNLPIAIRVAKKSGVGLDIIGKIADKNIDYWKSIEKDIDNVSIKYLGPQPHDKLGYYYSRSLALMFPSDVNEPFGLVAIEAQACGLPVLMLKGGSRGELIDEGKTGFLCSSDKEFANAIKLLKDIRPLDCKKFARKFDIYNMILSYEQLYSTLISEEN